MRSIIIGAGEVGISLFNVLVPHYTETKVVDKNGIDLVYDTDFDIMHVCFPYSEEFLEQVQKYKFKFLPKHIVIHSTVPVGTSKALGAIHSPIRGLHPNLESGIKTFPKFLAGEGSSQVADYFRRAGLKVVLFDDSRTTEALKLFDTEYYRTCIEFAHRVKKFCDKEGLNFSEVYTIPNITYNEGYTALGHPEYVRPVLQPIMKEIGGHCLLPNQKLIAKNE